MMNPIIAIMSQIEPREEPNDWFDEANEIAWSEAGEPDDTPGTQWWNWETEAIEFAESTV